MRPVIIVTRAIVILSISTCVSIIYYQHVLPVLPISPFFRSVSRNDRQMFHNKQLVPMTTSFTTFLKTKKEDPNRFCSESYRRSHWIAAKGIGRTGNSMFQLATLLATAKATCRTPAVSTIIHKKLGHMFDLSEFAKIHVNRQTKDWHVMTEKCRFSPVLLNLDPQFNWTLNGILNSWRNFHPHTDYVKSVFTFNKTILDSARRFLFRNDIVQKCPVSPSLRIGRRGDFLRLYHKGYRVVGMEYTIMARECFKKLFPDTVLCFIVVSDDLPWCKDNVPGDNVFYSTLETPGEDMALLSLCNHTIVSTGTFGWFGAWLAGGQVVYYSGFPRRDSKNCPTNGADFIPPGWIGLP